MSDEIRSFGLHPELASRRSQLDQLATALEGGKDRSRWAEIDLFRVLDVDVAPPSALQARLMTQVLQRISSGLILLPIFITWLGLYVAGRAYRDLLAVNPAAADRPFLKLWLTGFDGRTALSLDVVALITAVVLALVIADTVAISLWREGREAKDTLRRNELSQQLRTLVTRASLALVDYRLASPDRIRERIEIASEQLSRIVDQAQSIADSTKTNLELIQAIASKLDEGVHLSARVAGTIATASDRVRQSVIDMESGVHTAFTELAAENAGALNRSSSQIAGAVTGLHQSLEETLSSAATGSNAMAGAATAAGLAVSAIEQDLSKILAAFQSAITTQTSALLVASTDLQQGIAGSLTEVRSGVGEASADVKNGIASSLAQLGEWFDTAQTRLLQGFDKSLVGVQTGLEGTSVKLADHVDASNGWMVGAANAVLDQAVSAVSSSERTYDRVGQTVNQMSARLTDVAAANERANDLLAAHGEAVKVFAGLEASLTSLQRDCASLATHIDASDRSADRRHGEQKVLQRRQESLQEQQAAVLEGVQQALERCVATIEGLTASSQNMSARIDLIDGRLRSTPVDMAGPPGGPDEGSSP